MSRKPTQTKPTASRPEGKSTEDILAYERWLTHVVDHGPMEERAAAEGLLLEELQRPEPQRRSRIRILKRQASN